MRVLSPLSRLPRPLAPTCGGAAFRTMLAMLVVGVSPWATIPLVAAQGTNPPAAAQPSDTSTGARAVDAPTGTQADSGPSVDVANATLDDDARQPQAIAREEVVPPTYSPSPASVKLIASGERVGGKLRDIEQPCLRFNGFQCAERPLDAWHAALDQVEAAKGGDGPDAHVVVFGNSLIASDRITDIVRARLQERFGKGGGSYYLLDRLADYGGRWRTGKSNRQWDIYNFSQGSKGAYPFAVPGAHHVSQRRGARTRWRIEGDRVARVFWYDHSRSPGFKLRIDGKDVLDVKPEKTNQVRITELPLPAGAKSLDLIAQGARLVIHGAEMDMPTSGVRFDTHGIVAADSRKWMTADKVQFETELAARNPQLVIVMLGGNEVRRVAWRRYSLKTVEEQTSDFLERIHHILPGASCLVVGPLHAIEGKDHRRPFQTRPQLAPVNRIYREQALAHGCGFFDTYAAMGGDGSLLRFHKNRMLHADYVHPRADGLNFLGEFIAQGMFRAWVKTPRQLPVYAKTTPAGVLTPDPNRGDTQPLSAIQREARLLAQLDALERGEQKRVAIGVVGGGAGNDAAVALREALALRFGDRGPGMVRGLSRGKVVGQAVVTSPDPAAFGIAAGLDGDRVHLEKGSQYSLELPSLPALARSEGDDSPPPKATAQILWRNGPRAPRAKASVGKNVATLDREEGEALAGGVFVERLPMAFTGSVLKVESLDEGMLDLLAVAVESSEGGIVVDDLTHQNVRELLRLHPAVAAGQARGRGWNWLVFAPSAADLDARRPGLRREDDDAVDGALVALETLQAGVPAAHCIVIGPQGPKARFPDVDQKAKDLADKAGCGFFSTKAAFESESAFSTSENFNVEVGLTAAGRKRMLGLFLDSVAGRLDRQQRTLASRTSEAKGPQ